MEHTDEAEPSSSEPGKTHYCEPIRVEEYELQKKDVDGHLLALLESILNDENLSVSDRKKRLKKVKFRKQIYSFVLEHSF